jgi:hypothetical protein
MNINGASDQRDLGRVFDASRIKSLSIHNGHCLIMRPFLKQVLHPPATPVYLQHPTTCLCDPAHRLRKSLFPRYINIIGSFKSMVIACPRSHVKPDVVAPRSASTYQIIKLFLAPSVVVA